MSRRIEFLEEARTDYASARQWYAERSEPLAERFEAGVGRTLSALNDRFESFPRCPETTADIRWARVAGFPFGLIAAGRGEVILVLAVHHFRRAPEHWRDRL